MQKKFEWIVLLGAVFVLGRSYVHTKYDKLIKEITERHGNNRHLVKAIIKVESNFRPEAHNLTPKEDSRGLGQINKNTAISLGYINLEELFDPETNIEAMNKLLLDIKKRYSGVLDIIATYNAGRVRKDKQGFYINSQYVFKVYSYFLSYSILDV